MVIVSDRRKVKRVVTPLHPADQHQPESCSKRHWISRRSQLWLPHRFEHLQPTRDPLPSASYQGHLSGPLLLSGASLPSPAASTNTSGLRKDLFDQHRQQLQSRTPCPYV